MDSEKLKEWIEALTLSGSPVLDEKTIRAVKKLCKRSEKNVTEAFHLTFTQLTKEHSEVRLSSFLIIDQLFQRSHCFRTLVVKNLNRVISLIFEVNSSHPMPPPQEAAEILRIKAIIALDEWHDKFGNAYKRIKLAHHYLKTCHKIDFQTVTARNRAQQLLLKQKEEQRQKVQRETLEKTRAKIVDEKTGIASCMAELETGLSILVPTVTNICSNLEFDMDDFETDPSSTPESDVMRQHALGSSYNLEIDLNGVRSNRVAVSEKNTELVQNLDELVKEIERKKFKNIKKYILALTKNGGGQSEVVALVNLRERLTTLIGKYQSLNLIRPDPPKNESSGEDDDDEFEDVKNVDEKEGYEPTIPRHLRAEYGLSTESEAGSSLVSKSVQPQRLIASTTPKKRKHEEEAFDPTSASATIKLLNETGKLKKLKDKYSTKSETSGASGSQSNTNAPVVQYDKDLYYLFENPDAPLPVVERNESLHRFWTPREETMPEPTLPTSVEAGLKMRKMHFTGKFVPVQHKCNVPLPSGKLCPRMDRIKCPFHGVIIARDAKGLPLDDNLREKELKEKERREEEVTEKVNEEERKLEEASTSCEVPPWLDKELIKDIEAQTGKDLGSKLLEKREKKGKNKADKGKGKKSKKPESNLTNVKATNNNVRSRLEKKLFNPSTMKRVNGVLNHMDKQKTYEKFADNFNYVHGLDKG